MFCPRQIEHRIRNCFFYRLNYKILITTVLFFIVFLIFLSTVDVIPQPTIGRHASSYDPYEGTKPYSVQVTKESRSYSINGSPTCWSLDCHKDNNYHAKQPCGNEMASKWNQIGVLTMDRYLEGDRKTDSEEDYMNLYLKNAIEHFVVAISHDATCARAHANLGLAYMEQQKFQSALHHLTKAIDLDSTEARYYAMRSFMHELLGLQDQRIKDLAKAESLDKYIAERKYFGILLCNTTQPERYVRWPMIVQYTPQAELVFARKTLLYIEFSKISISDFALLEPGVTDFFIENKHTVIRKMIPPFLLRELQTCFHIGIKTGRIGFMDDQALRFVSQNDRCGRILLFNTVDLVRRTIAHNVRPAYSYFGGYINGSKLNPHSDRQQCEFTFSITVQQNPPDQAWALGMRRVPQFEKNDAWPGRDKEKFPEDKDSVWVDLYAGDGLLFMGRHMIHFRKGTMIGEKRWLNQVFLHYVQENFDGLLD